MDIFDGYAEGELPPDAPSLAEDVALIQAAAHEDPLFRRFLDKWFPVAANSSVDPTSRYLASSESFSGRSDHTNRQSLDETIKRCIDQSKGLNDRIAQLEQGRYFQLIRESAENYESYQARVTEAQVQVLQDAVTDEPLALHESEDIFNALHFDIQAGKSVDLDRALKHRSSIMQSMTSMLQREMANLETQMSDMHDTQLDSTSDEIDYAMKAEVVANMQEIAVNDKIIAELQVRTADASAEAKKTALEAVYLQLLSILDELVPETPAEQDKADELPDTASQRLKFGQAQRQLAASLAQLRRSFTANEADRPRQGSEELITKIKGLDLDEYDHHQQLQSLPLDLQSERKSADRIMAAFQNVRRLEEKLGNDKIRNQTMEIKNSHAMSMTLLEQAFAKRSMEAPSLADRDLYGVHDISVLTSAWKDTSDQRAAAHEAAINGRIENVNKCLDQVRETLDRTDQIIQDAQDVKHVLK